MSNSVTDNRKQPLAVAPAVSRATGPDTTGHPDGYLGLLLPDQQLAVELSPDRPWTEPLPLGKLWQALYEHERKAVEQMAKRFSTCYLLRDLVATDPHRPPDWRWLLACSWVNSGMPSLPASQQPTLDPAFRLLVAVAPQWPLPPLWVGADRELLNAHRCLSAPPVAKGLRLDLECLILAGLSSDSIANELGLSLPAIQAFESHWFDVRDRLACPSAITHFVIGTPGPDEALTDAMARERKRLAYWGGEHVAREFNRVVVDLPKPTSVDGVKAFLDADVRRDIERRGHLLLRCLRPDDPKQARMLLKVFTSLKLAESRAARKSGHGELNRWNRSGDLTKAESKQAIQYFLDQTRRTKAVRAVRKMQAGQSEAGVTKCLGNRAEMANCTTIEPPVMPREASENTSVLVPSQKCAPALI